MLKNKKILFIALTLLIVVVGFGWSLGVTNAVTVPATGGGGTTPTTPTTATPTTAEPIASSQDNCATGSSCCTEANCDLVAEYINPTIDFLAAGVGIVVVIMMVIGGIQYITSQDDPQKVAGAKSRITNALFALLIFAFMWSILEWLVPGGVF